MEGRFWWLFFGELASVAGNPVVFITVIVGDFADDMDKIWKDDGRIDTGCLDFQNGMLGAVGINVNLEILAAVALHDAVAGFADGVTFGVSLHKQLQIGVAIDAFFDLDAFSGIASVTFGGFGERVAAILATLADTNFFSWFRNEISLKNFDSLAIFHSQKRGDVRVFNEILAFDFVRQRLAEKIGDFGEQIVEFLLKIDAIFDDA